MKIHTIIKLKVFLRSTFFKGRLMKFLNILKIIILNITINLFKGCWKKHSNEKLKKKNAQIIISSGSLEEEGRKYLFRYRKKIL